jgi:F-type H+-transporting ATPase subunit alpha
VAPFKIKLAEKGTIKDIKKMIIRIGGLSSCLNGQIVDMGEGNKGIIMGFDEEDVLALLLGDESRIRIGQHVSGVSEPFAIPVGPAFVGRMVDALGRSCDERGDIPAEAQAPVFAASPGLTERAPVDQFLVTGSKVIDALVPIGKGQRQLIMGDRMTGKTVIGVDAILSQKGHGVLCIYCCIGKAVTALEKVVTVLAERGALEYTIVAAATDNASAGEQYIVPFAAATLGEYFMRRGRDVLVVLDDLTKHAWAYRQMSLLLERPPGREAYPGDIFYVQTQLMERAGRLNDRAGGGSMTFLGIVDTLQGDLTGYIPSNLISICDGMVTLSTTLFAEGQRPAVDLGLSMSIVGGKAQVPVLRDLTVNLRREFMQYSELVRLSKLQTALSREAEQVLRRGHAITASLQQPQFSPVGLEEQVLIFFALRSGYLDGVTPEAMSEFQRRIPAFAREREPDLLRGLAERPESSPMLEAGLRRIMQAYWGEKAGSGGETGPGSGEHWRSSR